MNLPLLPSNNFSADKLKAIMRAYQRWLVRMRIDNRVVNCTVPTWDRKSVRFVK